MIYSVDDLRAPAKSRCNAEIWDFLEGGSGEELSLEANRPHFAQAQLRPRLLVDVAKCDPSTTVFGRQLAAPIGIAPIAYHRLFHRDGELATTTGAGAAGSIFVSSFFASQRIEDLTAIATGPVWLQLYWLRDRDLLASLIGRANAAGVGALVLTVDAPQVGRRPRDLRNGFAVDPSIPAANLDPEVMARIHQRHAGRSAMADHAAATFDPSITWKDLAWLRSLTDLPIVLKGLLTAEDALLAVAHGVSGIIVSNHGGRQLDGAVPSLVALPEVVEAVAGACPVFLDGAVRSGRDIFIALALGAQCVFVGRPAIWALTVGGADGVAQLLAGLTEELAHTMALAGRPRLADITAEVLHR